MLKNYKLENSYHIVLSIFVTYLISFLLSKKKINRIVVILVALLTSKIFIGDWDVGFWKWTIVDIFYWSTLFIFAFIGTI